MRDLSDVEQAARHLEDARSKLRAAVRKAHEHGASLREIAKATRIYSHEQIRRMLDGK